MHQVSYGIEAMQLLYKNIFMLDRPCELQQRDEKCAPYFRFLIAECSGLFLCQTGLVIERACATFFKTYGKSKCAIVTIITFLLIIVISCSMGKILTWEDPLTGYSFSCLSFPKPSLHRANTYYFVCLCLAFSNLVITIMLMKYNKHLEYETRFKVGARFRKRETIESTETVCFLALSQFVLMFFYCGAVMILLYIKATVTTYVFSSWVIWIYSVPFIAMMLPLVLIYRIRSTRANRVQIIKSFAEAKHTQEDHINQMKQTWGEK